MEIYPNFSWDQFYNNYPIDKSHQKKPLDKPDSDENLYDLDLETEVESKDHPEETQFTSGNTCQCNPSMSCACSHSCSHCCAHTRTCDGCK